MSASPSRDWDLDQSLLALIAGAAVSGDEMRKVVGHLTFRLLLCRPLLSVLGQVYRFITFMGSARTPVWPSVKSELVCIRALLPLCAADLRAPYNGGSLMYDTIACLVMECVTVTLLRRR